MPRKAKLKGESRTGVALHFGWIAPKSGKSE